MSAPTLAGVLAAAGPAADDDTLLAAFLDWAAARGLRLYPAQENAILELFAGNNVILATPTGSGKSLVAQALLFRALARGRRAAYTCPVKALVNEKWLDLCRELGASNVGLSTGDATVNRDAPVLCCTAEILANLALRHGADTPCQDVVMDEFHYYADRERGVAWQVPLLAMPRARFLLMSATLGDTTSFERALRELTGRPASTVAGGARPVPLAYSWSESVLPSTVQALLRGGKAPVYVVHFTQADAAANAQAFTSLEVSDKEEKAALAKAMSGTAFSSPYGADLKRWLRAGIGLHHAGLLPKYRILVEKLAQRGLLKVICGTDTLGVGINVPIRTVVLTQLYKFDGEKLGLLSARDFHQVAGRAGRKGYDDEGFVVAQAPEHVIENAHLAAKAAKTGKKFVKRQPPERGYVPYDRQTFERLVAARPEKLESRFRVSHGMLLSVLSRETDGCRDMRDLVRRSHEAEAAKAGLRRRGFQLFRALLDKGVVAPVPPAGAGLARYRVHLDLQDDFRMNQPLALWLLDAIPRLDPASPDHHLDLLTLVESILENPLAILNAQRNLLKKELVEQLKASGMEYEERMARLEEVDYPKPLADFVYGTFNAFVELHPWAADEQIRPKSVAREMYQGLFTFSGYVKHYQLARVEGLLLRHLNDVAKVLAQTVPDAAKTDQVREVEAWFGDMVRRVDASLQAEWEALRDPARRLLEQAGEAAPEPPPDLLRDRAAFLATVRARIFSFLSDLQRAQAADALAVVAEGLAEGEAPADAEGRPWTGDRLAGLAADYQAGHGRFRLDPEGRAARHTWVEEREREGLWTVRQVLRDERDLDDWSADFTVDLAASRAAGGPVLRLAAFGPMR